MADILRSDPRGVTLRVRVSIKDWQMLCDLAGGTTPALIALRRHTPTLLAKLGHHLAHGRVDQRAAAERAAAEHAP